MTSDSTRRRDCEDPQICLCFGVSRRKIVQFLRVEKPQRASQLSQCYGAGTGCGWCRPFLQRIFDRHAAALDTDSEDRDFDTNENPPSPEDYAAARQRYRASGRRD